MFGARSVGGMKTGPKPDQNWTEIRNWIGTGWGRGWTQGIGSTRHGFGEGFKCGHAAESVQSGAKQCNVVQIRLRTEAKDLWERRRRKGGWRADRQSAAQPRLGLVALYGGIACAWISMSTTQSSARPCVGPPGISQGALGEDEEGHRGNVATAWADLSIEKDNVQA